MQAFRIDKLVKHYPDFTLGELTLDLAPGTVLGYIGPNGSGKSTTMHCLMRLITYEAGAVEIFGRANDPDAPAWKHDIGYVGDVQVFYENWSAGQNLHFLSKFYPNWSAQRVKELTARFNLPLGKKAKALSTGNRVKLALVAALAHNPRLLLLDEPTSGLDPVVRAEVLDVLFEVMEDGEHAIFYSTHILSDISRLADELAFLNDGRLIMRAAKDDLTETWRKISFRLTNNEVALRAAVTHQRAGGDHQVISADFETTMQHLADLGAEHVQQTRMPIDEIAVHILKGGGHVATHQG